MANEKTEETAVVGELLTPYVIGGGASLIFIGVAYKLGDEILSANKLIILGAFIIGMGLVLSKGRARNF